MAHVPKSKDFLDEPQAPVDRITELPRRQPDFRAPDNYFTPDDNEIRLLDLWRVVVEHKHLVLGITLGSIVLAVFIALFMQPVYRAEILLSPVQEEKSSGISSLVSQFSGLGDIPGINLGGGSNNTLEAIATLKSRALTTAFIKEENLMPVLFADRWDAAKQQWHANTEVPTDWDAFQLFDNNVRFVNMDSRSGLVTLAIEWHDPDLAAHWANLLVQRVNAQRRSEAIHEAETSINYLKQQLATTSSVEIQQAIYRLIEAQEKTIMVANSRSEYTFKVIDAAIAPQERIRPKRQWIVLQGFLIGLIISLFAAFIRASVIKHRKSKPA